MKTRTYVGFGFGAIQAGLLLQEAHRSEQFLRLTVAEVVPETVAALRNSGSYQLNVATEKGIEQQTVGPVEVFNPQVPKDVDQLVARIAEADEIGTALPSVNFFGTGQAGDVVSILRRGFEKKLKWPTLPNTVIYTAENNNHAAEILWKNLTTGPGALNAKQLAPRVQCLNTVIGKMSGIVTDPTEMQAQGLAPAVPGGSRAFLVEAFNRILITRVTLPQFKRGISVFEEKTDLFPFEEAKLYGHNATHALLGYLLWKQNCAFMSDAAAIPELISLARDAFLNESGAALCKKYHGTDPLFTQAGFAKYVDDLIPRMTNPFLRDQVDRITRDPRRKLGWDDRLVGTMRLALAHGIEPKHFVRGAAAALDMLAAAESKPASADLLNDVWKDSPASEKEKDEIIQRICGDGGLSRASSRGPRR